MKYSNRFDSWILSRFNFEPEELSGDFKLDFDKAQWKNFSKNENAMEILMHNQKHINWAAISGNLGATEFLYANKENVVRKYLVSNPHPLAIELLSEPGRADCIRDWNALLRNPAAVSIWRENYKLAMLDGYQIPSIYLTTELPPPWYNMGYSDPREEFIDLLMQHLEPFDDLQENIEGKAREIPATADKYDNDSFDWRFWGFRCLTQKNMDELMLNRNPKIIQILENLINTGRRSRIDWNLLSANPAAIEFLKKHPDDIDVDTIWANPAIFAKEYDYEGMRQAPRADKAELLAALMHPDRADAYLAAGGTLREFGAQYDSE